MSTATIVDVVGTPLDRVDGRLKVMGAATYPIDVTLPGFAYAVLVQSTVTSGRILHIAVDAAERAPGVLAVITHLNTPRVSACASHWENGRPDRSAALAAVPKRRRAALRPARRDGRRRDEGRSERGGGADRGHV